MRLKLGNFIDISISKESLESSLIDAFHEDEELFQTINRACGKIWQERMKGQINKASNPGIRKALLAKLKKQA